MSVTFWHTFWNQRFHSVEISAFSITLILREIDFGSKTAIFERLWILILMNFGTFWELKFAKFTNVEPLKCQIIADLELQEPSKMVSRKIRVSQKFLKFHTVCVKRSSSFSRKWASPVSLDLRRHWYLGHCTSLKHHFCL